MFVCKSRMYRRKAPGNALTFSNVGAQSSGISILAIHLKRFPTPLRFTEGNCSTVGDVY